MASLASCPHCRQAITLPVDVIPDQRFLCPHCQAEFAVQDAVSARSNVPSPSDSGEPNPGRRLQVEFVSDAAARLQALPSASLRRRSRQTNWLNQWIGIVGGGVMGLSIGYCILLRLRGRDADFLQIADRLPVWATGLPRPADAIETPDAPADSNSEAPGDESVSGEEKPAEVEK